MKELPIMDKRLEQLQKQYESVQIPDQLDEVVRRTIDQHQKKKPKRTWQKWSLGSAAAFAIFTASLNISPVMAKSLSGIPVLGDVVDVLTWKTYTVDRDNYTAHIEVPEIQNDQQSGITAQLNEKYRKEAEELYAQFMSDISEMEQMHEGGHLGVDSGYQVMTDTDQLLSISRYIVNTVGSSSTVIQYDTIDKKQELLLSLPILFKNDQYVTIISNYIIDQMKTEMKETNMDKVYWVADAGIPDEELFEQFTSIKPDQSFYITAEGKLVIAFDKYEVAPGYMGNPTFEIPSDLLQDVLVSDEYIH